jgi:hypothetical protein
MLFWAGSRRSTTRSIRVWEAAALIATVSTAVERTACPRSSAKPGWTFTSMLEASADTAKPGPPMLSAIPDS